MNRIVEDIIIFLRERAKKCVRVVYVLLQSIKAPHARCPPRTQSSQLASTDSRHYGQDHPLLPGKNTGNVAGNAALTTVFKPFLAPMKTKGRNCVIGIWTINSDNCQRKQISFLLFFHFKILPTVLSGSIGDSSPSNPPLLCLTTLAVWT